MAINDVFNDYNELACFEVGPALKQTVYSSINDPLDIGKTVVGSSISILNYASGINGCAGYLRPLESVGINAAVSIPVDPLLSLGYTSVAVNKIFNWVDLYGSSVITSSLGVANKSPYGGLNAGLGSLFVDSESESYFTGYDRYSGKALISPHLDLKYPPVGSVRRDSSSLLCDEYGYGTSFVNPGYRSSVPSSVALSSITHGYSVLSGPPSDLYNLQDEAPHWYDMSFGYRSAGLGFSAITGLQVPGSVLMNSSGSAVIRKDLLYGDSGMSTGGCSAQVMTGSVNAVLPWKNNHSFALKDPVLTLGNLATANIGVSKNFALRHSFSSETPSVIAERVFREIEKMAAASADSQTDLKAEYKVSGVNVYFTVNYNVTINTGDVAGEIVQIGYSNTVNKNVQNKHAD